MKRIENPQILNRIFELLQKELGVDAKTNQPFLCVDREIECDDCAFESKCLNGKEMKIDWLKRNWQYELKRTQIYELILEVIAIDKDGVLQRCRAVPCTSKTCKLFRFEDSYFCCTPTLIAWLEEEI